MNTQANLFPAEWELDFNWPPLVMPPHLEQEQRMERAQNIIRFTTCERCNRTMPQLLAIVQRVHTHQEDVELHFCSEDCGNDFYLERLREGL